MLLTYKTILSKKSQLNSDTHLYHFDLLEPKEISFKAGQYLIIKIPTSKGLVSRLYSIASPNTVKDSFELIIGIIPGGLASNYLYSLKENSEVVFQGPAGVFGLRENERTKVFMVTGTGIAPVRSILISNIKDQISKIQIKNQKYYLFWGLKNYKDVYLLDELKKLVTTVIPVKTGIQLKVCLSREQNLDMIPENDKKYFELGHIDSYSPLLTTADYYLCGGRQIVESLRQFLLSEKILQENIIFEKF